jgi:hypothetical protein
VRSRIINCSVCISDSSSSPIVPWLLPYIALRLIILEIHSTWTVAKIPRIEQEVHVLISSLFPFALCRIIALVLQASVPMHSSAFCGLLQISESPFSATTFQGSQLWPQRAYRLDLWNPSVSLELLHGTWNFTNTEIWLYNLIMAYLRLTIYRQYSWNSSRDGSLELFQH